MLHAKFHDQRERRILEVFTIYGHGDHLVTKTISINLCPRFQRRLHMKFGYDWPSDLREEAV